MTQLPDDETKKILLIEHNSRHIQFIAATLMSEGYNLSFAMDGGSGLQQIKDEEFDLIMINGEIPKLHAFDILMQMQMIAHNCDTPVIFLLNAVSTKAIEDLYDAGAVDYISVPFVAQEVITRVKTHLHHNILDGESIKQIDDAVRETMENDVSNRFEEIFEEHRERGVSQQEIIFSLCSLMEKRSKEKAAHVRRIADVSYLLALLVGFNDEEATLVKMAAPMHDIGNLAVPDAILSKPEDLTMDEFEQVEKHTQYGYEMLKDSSEPILKIAAIISQQHHEKYNGSGYPLGLKADKIHIFARIIALADVFDTLSEDRVYGKAWSNEDVEKYISDERGNHFDPTLVDLFLRHKERFFTLREHKHLF
jgi:putative two-component system response regulator